MLFGYNNWESQWDKQKNKYRNQNECKFKFMHVRSKYYAKICWNKQWFHEFPDDNDDKHFDALHPYEIFAIEFEMNWNI